MSKLLKQQIAKIQDEDLKKKLNAKKGLTQAKALQSIKAWRNTRVALRLFLSIVTIGLLPLFYFLWAKKNNAFSNYVTIPIQKTQEAIDGIKQLTKTPSENNDKAEEQSVELSANDSQSDKNHQQSSSSSELATPKEDKSKNRTQVIGNKKRDKVSQESEHSSASSSELVGSPDNQSKTATQISGNNKQVKATHVAQDSSSGSTELQASEESRSSKKTEVYLNKAQPKQVEEIKRFKPETVMIKAPGAASHFQVPPQVQHNGLVTFKCSNGKDTYYSANEIVRENLKALSSCPLEGGIIGYYPTNNSVVNLELFSDSLAHRSYKTANWKAAKLCVNPRFFIPLFINTNSLGELVEAVSVFDHKKNVIALNHYKNGHSETEEITFFEQGSAATISCASAIKNLIFIGCSNGKIYRVELNDDFSINCVNSITFTDQPILSIAIHHSGRALVILLSDGSVHYHENDKHLVLDIDIPSPQLTSLGFRNEDLLIAQPDNVLVAKNVGPKQEYLGLIKKAANYIPVNYPDINVKKQISIAGQTILIIMSDDTRDIKPYKICRVDQHKNCQYQMFEMGLGFSCDFLEPFCTSSGYLAFYYIDTLTKELQFYNEAGELLGSVPKFTRKWGANIEIENFNVEPGLGSKLLMEGSLTVTEEGKTTRYTFTESTCATESVPTPATAYAKVLSRPKREEKKLTQLVESTPSKEPVVDTSTMKAREQKIADIGDGERDYDFVWTATTDSAEHLGCKRIRYPDGNIAYEIGLWPEKFDHVGKLPVHTLFLTKDENAKNWTPILSKEKQWNFFSYTNEGIFVYDDSGKEILKIEKDNADYQLIPAEVSTTKGEPTTLTLIEIYKSRHLHLVKLDKGSLFDIRIPDITTAYYDSKNQHLYVATKSNVLYQIDVNTKEQRSINLTYTHAKFGETITKIVLNEDRNLMCLRFGERILQTYAVDFDRDEIIAVEMEDKKAKTVGWIEVENVKVYDMQFTHDDVLVRFATTIGYHETLNRLPKNMVNGF